jgi:ribose transport system substrate-binding protein
MDGFGGARLSNPFAPTPECAAPSKIDAINSGVMAGAITQNPVGMGKELVSSAMKAINGEELPKVIDTGFYWYDKSNVDDPKIKAVLCE